MTSERSGTVKLKLKDFICLLSRMKISLTFHSFTSHFPSKKTAIWWYGSRFFVRTLRLKMLFNALKRTLSSWYRVQFKNILNFYLALFSNWQNIENVDPHQNLLDSKVELSPSKGERDLGFLNISTDFRGLYRDFIAFYCLFF